MDANRINLNLLFAGENSREFIVQLDKDYTSLKEGDYIICRIGFFPSTHVNPQFCVKMTSLRSWCIESFSPEKPLKNGLEAPKHDFRGDMGISRDTVAVVTGLVRKYL